jgi:hypothetical protein
MCIPTTQALILGFKMNFSDMIASTACIFQQSVDTAAIRSISNLLASIRLIGSMQYIANAEL